MLQSNRQGAIIFGIVSVALLFFATSVHAQFGGILTKISSISCGALSGFSVPCDYDTGGPLDVKQTVAISAPYGTAVASCQFISAWGRCTASCPSGYVRTGCSAAPPISTTGYAVSPAENGCTCAAPTEGLCLVGYCPKATCYTYCLKASTASNSQASAVSESNSSNSNAAFISSSQFATSAESPAASSEGSGEASISFSGMSGSGGGGIISVPPPEARLDLRLIPSFVHSGDTTQVNWSSANVQSCIATGDNGDAWTSLQSILGGNTSKPISRQTTYTLSCVDLAGLTKNKTATVSIQPSFRER